MKQYVFLFVMSVLAATAFSQTHTPCSDCDTIPSRYEKYYYTQWYDESPYYSTNGYKDSCTRIPFRLDYYPGGLLAKWEYTRQPLKVKGLVALVHIYANYSSYADTTKLPEYLYLYQKINEYYVHPNHPIPMGITMQLVDSVRWDTIKPHIMEFKQGDTGEVFNRCYAYEAYFDEPVWVDSSFFIFGSGNNNKTINYTGVFWHIPTFYVQIRRVMLAVFEKGCTEPFPPVIYPDCKPWGEAEAVWCGPQIGFRRPYLENFYGMFLAIVDQYRLDVYTDSAEIGTVTGGGRFPEETHDTIEAHPKPGYKFVGWNDGNTENPRVIFLTQDTAFTAFFAPAVDSFSVMLRANDPMLGSVMGAGTFHEQSEVTIKAIPNPYCTFLHWSDGDRSNPKSFRLVQDTVLTAIFAHDAATGFTQEIASIEVLQFSLSPNPTHTTVTIANVANDSQSCRAAIVDLSGRTLLTHDFTGATTTIDISALPAGRYFVTLTSADGRHGHRALVKN